MNPETPVDLHSHCATGVLHVHSTRSDGTGEPEEIADAAAAAGLDFLAFNDHRNLALMDEGWHGRRTGSTITVVGSELQHSDLKSHLLVYGVDKVRPSGHILDQLADVKERGGIAIIAHPRETRPLIPGIGEYPWGFGTDHPVDGIEGWNWMSSWKRRVDPVNVWNRIKFPDDMVRHPHSEAVDMWFQTGGALVGGADAHGHRIMGRDVFDYRMLFDRVRTHLLLDEPLTDPAQFTEALRDGNRCFISNAIAGDAGDFRAVIRDRRLVIRLPGEGRAAFRDSGGNFGAPLTLGPGTHDLGEVKPPLYLEIYRRGRTWIAMGIPGEER